jgi:hypothetical protein
MLTLTNNAARRRTYGTEHDAARRYGYGRLRHDSLSTVVCIVADGVAQIQEEKDVVEQTVEGGGDHARSFAFPHFGSAHRPIDKCPANGRVVDAVRDSWPQVYPLDQKGLPYASMQ